jgi:hypothetical protein
MHIGLSCFGILIPLNRFFAVCRINELCQLINFIFRAFIILKKPYFSSFTALSRKSNPHESALIPLFTNKYELFSISENQPNNKPNLFMTLHKLRLQATLGVWGQFGVVSSSKYRFISF